MNRIQAKIIETEEMIEDINKGNSIKFNTNRLKNVTLERLHYELYELYREELENTHKKNLRCSYVLAAIFP